MKRLRSGYTTGACAAAAAKGAAITAISGKLQSCSEITFPDGRRIQFPLAGCHLVDGVDSMARCSVIKDAGDDPDVTNGAEITAEVAVSQAEDAKTAGIAIFGGTGVGRVTKPGLALPVGSPAINPVPLAMINTAVEEAFLELGRDIRSCKVQVTVSIPEGERLARYTLNSRLGIVGGLSVLGTTGIVVPVSSEAWTATISASMDVAREMGVREIVLSTGRTSERAVEAYCRLPDEAYVMMGDYLEFSLREAAKHQFRKIHLAGMWAKIVKAAMNIPQTHVRHGALDPDQAISFLDRFSSREKELHYLRGANSVREIYERLDRRGATEVIQSVCLAARNYCQSVSGLPVTVYLVKANGRIILTV